MATPLHLKPATGREDQMLSRKDLDKARELNLRLQRVERALTMVMETDTDHLQLTIGVQQRYGDNPKQEFAITQNDAMLILSQQGQDLAGQLERLGVKVQEDSPVSFLPSVSDDRE